MTKLPILYSRTSTGAIETWEIIVDGGTFYSRSGQLNGKITQNLPTVCLVKNAGKVNETSVEEQAQSEAQSKWDKKLKTGYFEKIEDIDNFYFVEPMLATPLNKIKGGVKFPSLLQCKFNGARCIATKDGLFSRKGERFLTVPHIEESLKPFFVDHKSAVLDGELFNEDLRQSLNELMSIIRRTVNITPAHLARSKELVQLHVYDGYGIDGLDETVPYSTRKAGVDKEIRGGRIPYVVPVNTVEVKNEAEMWAEYNRLIDDNHEGAIVRYASNTYEHKRSKSIIKLKPEDSSEAVIVDILPGTGNWANTGKVIKLNWKGMITDATFKGTMEDCAQFLVDRDKWIGKEVTFLYNGLTGLGAPNYSRVDFNNCLKS